MNIFDAVTVSGKVTQGTAASGAQDLIRLGKAQMLLSNLFQGAWLAGTAYTAGQMVTADGALWLARANSTGLEPITAFIFIAAGAACGMLTRNRPPRSVGVSRWSGASGGKR